MIVSIRPDYILASVYGIRCYDGYSILLHMLLGPVLFVSYDEVIVQQFLLMDHNLTLKKQNITPYAHTLPPPIRSFHHTLPSPLILYTPSIIPSPPPSHPHISSIIPSSPTLTPPPSYLPLRPPHTLIPPPSYLPLPPHTLTPSHPLHHTSPIPPSLPTPPPLIISSPPPSHPSLPPSPTGPLVAALLPSSDLLCCVDAWSPADVRLYSSWLLLSLHTAGGHHHKTNGKTQCSI